MRILLALALAAPGDYKAWIDTAKQPGYLNTGDAASAFALFKQKARDAKAVSTANQTSYDDFDPVSSENGSCCWKSSRATPRLPGAEAAARDAIGALEPDGVHGDGQDEGGHDEHGEADAGDGVGHVAVGAQERGARAAAEHNGPHELLDGDPHVLVQRKSKAHAVGPTWARPAAGASSPGN